MSEVQVDRPLIPSGYGVNAGHEGLLAWERVAAALAAAEIYWVASCLDTIPHLVPIHGVAIDGTVYVSGDADTKWARNLAANPAVEVGVQHDGLQVMARGVAILETPSLDLHRELQTRTDSKYGWSHGDEPIPHWTVRPSKILAFDPAEFATSPTRFTFEEHP